MKSINQAFQEYSRSNFVPEGYKKMARLDTALPISFGQTISQPTVVISMLEWLEAKPGLKALDVGSGSGWTSALISYLVGPRGKVTAVEIVPELLEFSKHNIKKLGIENVEFHKVGKTIGWPPSAPYDIILVSASAKKVPNKLLNQLKVSGKMVIPVFNDILEIYKKDNQNILVNKHPGYVFVPLL